MNLELHNLMPFGKYKGKTLEAIFKENSGYLVWLRQQRADANSQPKFMSDEVSALLDMAIMESKPLQKKYKPWNVPIITQPVNTTAEIVRQPEQEIAYIGWGEF